jgi:predicted short-subunit dehydrogenase-like oxidoreductase (DUF2520 family)
MRRVARLLIHINEPSRSSQAEASHVRVASVELGDRNRGRAKRLSSTNVPSALHVVCVIALCVAGFRSVGVHLHLRLIGEGGGIEILEIVA